MVSVEPLGEANLGWLEGMTNGEHVRSLLRPCCCLMPAASSALPVGFHFRVAEPVPLLGRHCDASALPCSNRN